MNTALIEQLKLAIQVERGEVPLSEIQCRPLKGFEENGGQWGPVHFSAFPKTWRFVDEEFRLKPKSLECWVNYPASSTHSVDAYTSRDAAELSAKNYGCSMLRTAVHMREVTND